MAFNGRQAAFLRPAAIAVHDDGDVARHDREREDGRRLTLDHDVAKRSDAPFAARAGSLSLTERTTASSASM